MDSATARRTRWTSQPDWLGLVDSHSNTSGLVVVGLLGMLVDSQAN